MFRGVELGLLDAVDSTLAIIGLVSPVTDDARAPLIGSFLRP